MCVLDTVAIAVLYRLAVFCNKFASMCELETA